MRIVRTISKNLRTKTGFPTEKLSPSLRNSFHFKNLLTKRGLKFWLASLESLFRRPKFQQLTVWQAFLLIANSESALNKKENPLPYQGVFLTRNPLRPVKRARKNHPRTNRRDEIN